MSNPHFSKISRRRFFYYGFAGLAGLTGAGITRYLPGTSWAAKTEDGIMVEDAVYQGIRESLGKYIYLTPQKLGGGPVSRKRHAAGWFFKVLPQAISKWFKVLFSPR